GYAAFGSSSPAKTFAATPANMIVALHASARVAETSLDCAIFMPIIKRKRNEPHRVRLADNNKERRRAPIEPYPRPFNLQPEYSEHGPSAVPRHGRRRNARDTSSRLRQR
ncbi:hypothetical protein, partial [Caballeronia sp. GAOx1]|uniref:hypothetical protein n=1 Tax=Caballeronia sp. GAOx1 TaxID=2921761 RepID=UPI0020293207